MITVSTVQLQTVQFVEYVYSKCAFFCAAEHVSGTSGNYCKYSPVADCTVSTVFLQ